MHVRTILIGADLQIQHKHFTYEIGNVSHQSNFRWEERKRVRDTEREGGERENISQQSRLYEPSPTFQKVRAVWHALRDNLNVAVPVYHLSDYISLLPQPPQQLPSYLSSFSLLQQQLLLQPGEAFIASGKSTKLESTAKH